MLSYTTPAAPSSLPLAAAVAGPRQQQQQAAAQPGGDGGYDPYGGPDNGSLVGSMELSSGGSAGPSASKGGLARVFSSKK